MNTKKALEVFQCFMCGELFLITLYYSKNKNICKAVSSKIKFTKNHITFFIGFTIFKIWIIVKFIGI